MCSSDLLYGATLDFVKLFLQLRELIIYTRVKVDALRQLESMLKASLYMLFAHWYSASLSKTLKEAKVQGASIQLATYLVNTPQGIQCLVGACCDRIVYLLEAIATSNIEKPTSKQRSKDWTEAHVITELFFRGNFKRKAEIGRAHV